MYFTAITGRFLSILLMVFTLAAATISGTAAQSSDWNDVPELATDPREGWVILTGPEEGQTYAAQCRGAHLEKVSMNQSGWVISWTSYDNPMCSDEAPAANLDPSRFQDPRFSWIILPNEPGVTNPARCHGADLYFIRNSQSGIQWIRYPMAPICDARA